MNEFEQLRADNALLREVLSACVEMFDPEFGSSDLNRRLTVKEIRQSIVRTPSDSYEEVLKLRNEVEALKKDAAENKLDRLGRECLRIGRAIQLAAGELPECFEIEIMVEQGAGVVHLIDDEGDRRYFDFDENLSDSIYAAIDAAKGDVA